MKLQGHFQNGSGLISIVLIENAYFYSVINIQIKIHKRVVKRRFFTYNQNIKSMLGFIT
jgi:hypothetical protein